MKRHKNLVPQTNQQPQQQKTQIIKMDNQNRGSTKTY